MDSSGSGEGAEVCQHSDEFFSSLKVGKFLEQLSDYSIIKTDYASWS
jgi:hypothetical protein